MNFDLMTTGKLHEVKEIQLAFQKKHILEKEIANLIKDFEDETGLAIDSINYQRDITLPIRRIYYLSLSVIVSEDEK